jgi:hypothetical protein
MSSERDLERAVRAWLDEGSTRLPDPYLDAALEEISTTSQRRRRWPPLRFLSANSAVPLATAAAAVVILAVGAMLLVPNRGSGGPGPDTPTPGPTPVQLREADIDSVLDAGTYVIDAPFPIRIALTTPDAWTMRDLRRDVTDIEQATRTPTVGLGFWIVDDVFAVPCREAGEYAPPIGPSVDDLVSAFDAIPAFIVTPATDVTFAGLPAVQLEIAAPEDVPGCADPRFAWRTPTGEVKVMKADENAVVTILDVHGTRLVVYAVDFPGASDADLAALDAVVRSIRFDEP